MARLLLDDSFLIVQPKLAHIMGLHEAMLLQHLHNMLSNPKMGKMADGRKWVYMKIDDWQEQVFPFLTTRTVKALVGALEGTGIIEARQDLNKLAYDRTKWYTINYAELRQFTDLCVTAHTTHVLQVERNSSMESEEKSPSQNEKQTLSDSEKISPTITIDSQRITKNHYAGSEKSSLPAASDVDHVTSTSDQQTRTDTLSVPADPKRRKDRVVVKDNYTKTAKDWFDELVLLKQEYAIFQSDDTVRKTAEVAFRMCYPHLTPPKSSKSAGALWWAPLREICDLAHWQLDAVIDLIQQTKSRMGNVTVKSPKSILSTARDVTAKGEEASPPTPASSPYNIKDEQETERWKYLRSANGE